MAKFRFPILLFAFVFPTFLTWVYFSLLSDSPAWVQKSVYGVLKGVQFLLPVAWFLIDRHCFENPEDQTEKEQVKQQEPTSLWDGPIGQFSVSTLFGVVVVVAMFGLYFLGIVNWAEGELLKTAAVDKVSSLNLGTPLQFAGLGIFYALVHSFLEEYYWRWFVFRMTATRTGFAWAAVLSSIGFMSHHVILLTHFFGWQSWLAWFCAVGVAVGGVAWCWMYRQSQRLTVPWVSHLIVDAGIFGLGYFVIRDTFQ